MKRMMALLLAVLMQAGALMGGGAALAEVDNQRLEAAEDMTVFLDDRGVDLIIRPQGQPYIGTADDPSTEAVVFLDLVEMPNAGATVLRLMLSVNSDAPVNARTLALTVGGQTWTFDVEQARQEAEYDMMYYEDYTLGMTDESLPMVKAMARAKSDEFTLTLAGDRTVNVTVTIPGDVIDRVYKLYVDAGGPTQALELLRDIWPVKVSK